MELATGAFGRRVLPPGGRQEMKPRVINSRAQTRSVREVSELAAEGAPSLRTI